MADWFKFYENDLDETRLQYAIAKLPEVVSVWLGILSECCRHKNGTIRWGSNEIELFGFSRRLNISIPKVNEAINLLSEIEYIKHDGNVINVLKWNNKQSEYCQAIARKSKVNVPRVSRETTESVVLEERRGEEIRIKNARASNGELSAADKVVFNQERERVEKRIKEISLSVESHRDLEPKDRDELKKLKARKSELLSALRVSM